MKKIQLLDLNKIFAILLCIFFSSAGASPCKESFSDPPVKQLKHHSENQIRYRKKPVVIEAFQWTEESSKERESWPDWLLEATAKRRDQVGAVYQSSLNSEHWYINTLKDPLKFTFDEWIAKGSKGELYPVKGEIFEETYEKVDENQIRYRKKPVVNEAFQWTEESSKERESWPNWLLEAIAKRRDQVGAVYQSSLNSEHWYINTLENPYRVTFGEWIIKGVKGDVYPVRDEIFKEVYEKIYER